MDRRLPKAWSVTLSYSPHSLLISFSLSHSLTSLSLSVLHFLSLSLSFPHSCALSLSLSVFLCFLSFSLPYCLSQSPLLTSPLPPPLSLSPFFFHQYH